MNTQLKSNVINIADAASKQPSSSIETRPLVAISHEELRQLLSSQLQSTLDLENILTLFFQTSQRLVNYDSLAYKHAAQKISIELGSDQEHSVTYSLNYQGDYLGHIVFTRAVQFSEQELADFESIMSSVIFPLRNGLLYAAALQSALLDPLTEVGNRNSMQQTLQRDIRTARRNEQPLAVLMIDIDYFKQINDSYGHSAGDTVLVQVAQHIQQQLRSTDALFRYGGEEFLAVLPNTAKLSATVVAERILDAMLQLKTQTAQQEISVTVSIGCAVLEADDTIDSLLQRSDMALYSAKNKGRNQVQPVL